MTVVRSLTGQENGKGEGMTVVTSLTGQENGKGEGMTVVTSMYEIKNTINDFKIYMEQVLME